MPKLELHYRVFGALLLAAMLTVNATAHAQDKNGLGQNGQLRTAFVLSEKSLISRDRQGHLRGLLLDIANALASDLKLSLRPVPYDNLVQFHRSIGKDTWDVAIIPRDLSRVRILAFSEPFLRVEYGYVARAGSGLLSASDVDRVGIKVAVAEYSPADAYLTRNLTRAKIVHIFSGVDQAQSALAFGRADVYAGDVSTANHVATGVPGAMVLTGTFSTVPLTFALPKPTSASLPKLNDFIQQAVTDGTITAAITNAHVTGVRLPLLLKRRGQQ